MYGIVSLMYLLCTAVTVYRPGTVEVGKCVANLVHQPEVSGFDHIVPESVGLGVVRRYNITVL